MGKGSDQGEIEYNGKQPVPTTNKSRRSVYLLSPRPSALRNSSVRKEEKIPKKSSNRLRMMLSTFTGISHLKLVYQRAISRIHREAAFRGALCGIDAPAGVIPDIPGCPIFVAWIRCLDVFDPANRRSRQVVQNISAPFAPDQCSPVALKMLKLTPRSLISASSSVFCAISGTSSHAVQHSYRAEYQGMNRHPVVD